MLRLRAYYGCQIIKRCPPLRREFVKSAVIDKVVNGLELQKDELLKLESSSYLKLISLGMEHDPEESKSFSIIYDENER